jgi:hypothetical protein
VSFQHVYQAKEIFFNSSRNCQPKIICLSRVPIRRTIELKRRSIQSQAESSLSTRRIPSVVNLTFLYYRPRDT